MRLNKGRGVTPKEILGFDLKTLAAKKGTLILRAASHVRGLRAKVIRMDPRL